MGLHFGTRAHSFFLAAALLAILPARAEPARDLGEELVSVPVSLKELYGRPQTRTMYLTLFRPKGKGPFPLAVISHGRAVSREQRAAPSYQRLESASRFLVRKGFLVIVPTRVGYGATGQDFDPEETSLGKGRDYSQLADAASTQVLAAVDYGRAMADVDPSRIVLVGQSVGGLATVASAARNPPGVVAAINFAGGAGGDPERHPGTPLDPGQLKDLYRDLGKTARVPMLWIYTQNDRYFGPDCSQAWAKAFAAAGGQVDYRLLPAFRANGHELFAEGCDLWMPLVEEYLKQAGFPQPGLLPRPQPTRFAALEAVAQVPGLQASGQEGYRKFLEAAPPRAFALSSDGHWGWAHGDDALSRALANCLRSAGPEASGRLYAVDSDIVW